MMSTSAPRNIAAALCALVLLLVATAAQAQVVRDFTPRASFNQPGNVAMIGNTLMTCTATGTPACGSVQSGASSGSNNSRPMGQVNEDPTAGFINSSSATLALPPDSTVLFAGLYWGARTDPANTDRSVVQLRLPGSGAYQAINATQVDTINGSGQPATRPYLAFADVTDLVQAAGNGSYTVGGVVASTGSDSLGFYGGWSLVVLYRNTAEPFRRLMVYDGAANVSGTNTVSATVDGLLTPPAGSFDTFAGALTWEGDESISGDQFRLNGTDMADILNPGTNFWNGTITRLGTRLGDKTPDYVNQLGMDIVYVDASGILPNSAESASIEFVTTGDAYFPHALTFAVDLFVPDLVTSLAKDVVDLNGGAVELGDELEYTISFTNNGQDGAANVIIDDPIPEGTAYVPGTLEILTNAGGAPTGQQTDAAGDDLAEFLAGPDRVVFRLGSGAGTSSGGLVSPGESVSLRFNVRVNEDLELAESDITNTAHLSYHSQTLGEDEQHEGETSATVTVAPVADLSVTKSNDVDGVTADEEVVYRIVVSNDGPSAADGALVRDPPAEGLTCTALTCGDATGGAVCPAAPEVAQLQGSGVEIPTLPTGGTLTFSLTCTVTATGSP